MSGDYQWEPIKPLLEAEKKIDLADISPLYDTWKKAKAKLESSSPESLKIFTKRLVRRLSIESGILERLYDLDRGTTEALVTNGFIEDLVSRSDTDIEPSHLIDILEDHEAAIKLVMDCIAGNREISKGLVHELHAILTRHQASTVAVSPEGQRIEIPLLRGKFKEQPNNPRRPDGATHEYAPPVQVDTEVERLLELLTSYSAQDPVIVAAWFHHRFTQIHPYQDGNGRTVRALTTLLLLRAGLLPLVIDRDMRVEYLDALQKADFGDLTALALLFARQERGAILQALSVDPDVEISQERRLTSAVIQNLAAKFDRRRAAQDTQLRKVNDVALRLRQSTKRFLEDALTRLKVSVSQVASAEVHIAEGGPDKGNAYWYKFEVIQTAQKAGKFVNFKEAHHFIKATMKVDRDRLVFVTSFHHVGHDLTGIMEATAFSYLESYEDSEDQEAKKGEFRQCSLEPFVFTYMTQFSEIDAAYDHWLDMSLAVALKEFGDRL